MNKNVKRYNIFFVSSNNIIIKCVIVHLKQRNFSKFLNQILQESHFPFIQRFINSIISAYPFHYSILLSISIYFYLKNPFICRPRSTRSVHTISHVRIFGRARSCFHSRWAPFMPVVPAGSFEKNVDVEAAKKRPTSHSRWHPLTHIFRQRV